MRWIEPSISVKTNVTVPPGRVLIAPTLPA
jgi:hypothetical protein